MRKKQNLIIFILVIIAFVGTMAYAVVPSKNIRYYTHSQNKTFTQALINTGDTKIKNNSLEMNFNENNINEVISSVDNISRYRIVLNEKDADINIPVEFMKVIKTNINVRFDVRTEDNKLMFIVKESRLGKMKINNKHIMKYVKNGIYNDFTVETRDNDIIVSSKIIRFKEAHIKNNELFVKCDLNYLQLIEWLKNKNL